MNGRKSRLNIRLSKNLTGKKIVVLGLLGDL